MKNDIIIVSGLPRSGTSMMMKMLEAGGIPVLVDHIRKPDEDNPKGYYEFEKVKHMDQDCSWLDDAGGKAVKMVSKLLKDLPAEKHYKIIFMRRHMDEIIRSQNKMLERGKGRVDSQNDSLVAELFEKHLLEMEKWIKKQPYLDCIYISYNEMLKNPEPYIKQIDTFLGGMPEAANMKSVIDKSLYRQNAEKQ